MRRFSEEEVRKNTLKYFKGDNLATTVWMSKYCLKDSEGFLESSPVDRFKTIAKEIYRIEKQYESDSELTEDVIFSLLGKHILPGGSGITGIGNPYSIVSLGNCFVVGSNGEDSYGAIMKTDQEIVQIAKRRGGVGHDLSHIRFKGTAVKNAAITSTGSVSFAERFSNSTREVGQDGRRGALMLSQHINHPDIMEFIYAKDNGDKITGANVSVRVTDEFMQSVRVDGVHQLRFPVDIPFKQLDVGLNVPVDLEDGFRMNVSAKEVFNALVDVNWKRAEPGILFWDKIIKESPADRYPGYKSTSTNPCGEIPLSPYDSCRLLSISLPSYVKNPFTKYAKFDSVLFRKHVRWATRIMDNIIDLEIEKIEAIIRKIESDPESEFTKSVELNLWKNVLKYTQGGRRAGISLIGHGDFLAMLGMPYGTTASNNYLEWIHFVHANSTYRESQVLAEKRGVFLDFNEDLDGGDFLDRIEASGIPRRNIALLTIPPSGTISIIFNNQSSGVEPVFSLWYERSRKVNEGEEYDYIDEVGDLWKTYVVFHPNFKLWAKVNGVSEKDLIANKEKWAEKSPYFGSTSHDINPVDKVHMQGKIQKYVDHSISMTTNLKQEVKREDIGSMYMEAWESGCKGATVYRDGSRTGVLNISSDKRVKFEMSNAPERPRELQCDIFHPTIGGESYIVMVGIMDERPYEVFAIKNGHIPEVSKVTSGIIRKQKSKHWQLLSDDKEILIDNIIEEFDIPEYGAVTKLASLSLRHGAAIDHVVKILNNNDGVITAYSKVIARQLKKYLKVDDYIEEPCPECGQPMVIEGGCKQCKNEECGYGQCG